MPLSSPVQPAVRDSTAPGAGQGRPLGCTRGQRGATRTLSGYATLFVTHRYARICRAGRRRVARDSIRGSWGARSGGDGMSRLSLARALHGAARVHHAAVLVPLVSLLVLLSAETGARPVGAQGGVDWATYGFDLARSGYNPSEATLTTDNVSRLERKWSADLGDPITAQPLYAAGVAVGGQTRDLVYVGT